MKKQTKTIKNTKKTAKKPVIKKNTATKTPKKPVKACTTNKSTKLAKKANKATTKGRISTSSKIRVQENKNGVTIYFK